MRKAFEGVSSNAMNFGSRREGNVTIVFGLASLPIMMMVGASADYTRYANTRSGLQHAADVAALTVASKMTASTTQAQAEAQAQNILNAQPRMEGAQITSASISGDKQTFCVGAQTQVDMAFMRLAHVSTMTPTVASCASLPGGVDPNTTYEIALVLDNSGSMTNSTNGQTKLQALKSAATSFVNTMFSKAPGKVQFAITPFAGGVVAVDPTVLTNQSLSWIDALGLNSQHWIAFGGKAAANASGFVNRFDIFAKLKLRDSEMAWRGCFEEPTYPRNVQDTTPSASDAETLFVPYLAPDEPDGSYYYDNSYIDDDGAVTTGSYRNRTTTYSCSDTVNGAWNNLTHVCKYKPTASISRNFSPTSFFGPNQFCPDNATQTLMPLNATQTTITSKIGQLAANGNTNLHTGFMWGWRSFSPNGPFAQGRAYNAPNNRKIMVFMTDGFNNWGTQTNTVVGSDYEALGYYTYNGAQNARLPDGSDGDGVNYRTALAASANKSSSYLSTSRKAVDDLTLEACANAKAAGIEVYTIGFSIPTDPIDTQGLNLLKACATNEDHYFAATDASQLNAAFTQIGIGMGKLRLSL